MNVKIILLFGYIICLMNTMIASNNFFKNSYFIPDSVRLHQDISQAIEESLRIEAIIAHQLNPGKDKINVTKGHARTTIKRGKSLFLKDQIVIKIYYIYTEKPLVHGKTIVNVDNQRVTLLCNRENLVYKRVTPIN